MDLGLVEIARRQISGRNEGIDRPAIAPYHLQRIIAGHLKQQQLALRMRPYLVLHPVAVAAHAAGAIAVEAAQMPSNPPGASSFSRMLAR